MKNPHCALSAKQNLSNGIVSCRLLSRRIPPSLKSALFVFSMYSKPQVRFNQKIVTLNVSCQTAEVYDPFKGTCLPVHSTVRQKTKASSSNTGTSTTEHVPCQGPLFLPTEFKICKSVTDLSSFFRTKRTTAKTVTSWSTGHWFYVQTFLVLTPKRP